MVAKRTDGVYQPDRRRSTWVKVKNPAYTGTDFSSARIVSHAPFEKDVGLEPTNQGPTCYEELICKKS